MPVLDNSSTSCTTYVSHGMSLRYQVSKLFVRNLFPHPGPSTDTQKYEIEVDTSTGAASPNNADPNASGFGFYILSGIIKCRAIVHKWFLTFFRGLGRGYES
jgi:hypothetical protein